MAAGKRKPRINERVTFLDAEQIQRTGAVTDLLDSQFIVMCDVAHFVFYSDPWQPAEPSQLPQARRAR